MKDIEENLKRKGIYQYERLYAYEIQFFRYSRAKFNMSNAEEHRMPKNVFICR